MSKIQSIGCSTNTAMKKPPRMTTKAKHAMSHYDLDVEALVLLWQEHRANMPARLDDGEVHQTELRAAMKSGRHSVLIVASSVCRKGRLRHIFHAPGEDSNRW
jgi:hypothetical protein